MGKSALNRGLKLQNSKTNQTKSVININIVILTKINTIKSIVLLYL